MENNKNKKSVKFQGDTLNFCDFIQVFVFTRNHHLKRKTTNKPNPVVRGMRIHVPVYSCYHIHSKVSDKNACRSIDSDLITVSTILDSIIRRFVVV